MSEFTGNDELAPPDPPSVGSQAITAKHTALKQGGFDLGPAQSNHLPTGDGGLVRAYANGQIYWSPQTGAHEVHGGILQQSRAELRQDAPSSTEEQQTSLLSMPCP